jgi:hypothetical protein
MTEFECSDRIVICDKWFQTSGLDSSTMHSLKLSNILNESFTGTLYKTHCDTDVCYVPSRLFNSLSVTNNILITSIQIEPCKAFILEPANTSFNKSPSWKEDIQKGLQYYTSITQKTRIQVPIGGIIEIFTIYATDPIHFNTVLIRHEGVMEISFNRSTEEERILYNQTYYSTQEVPKACFVPFEGVGQTVGGTIKKDDKRDVCLKATKKRLEKQYLHNRLYGPPPEVTYTRVVHQKQKPYKYSRKTYTLFGEEPSKEVVIPVFTSTGYRLTEQPVETNLSLTQLCVNAAKKRMEQTTQ